MDYVAQILECVITYARLAFRGNAKYVPDFRYHWGGKWLSGKYCCMLKYAVFL